MTRRYQRWLADRYAGTRLPPSVYQPVYHQGSPMPCQLRLEPSGRVCGKQMEYDLADDDNWYEPSCKLSHYDEDRDVPTVREWIRQSDGFRKRFWERYR